MKRVIKTAMAVAVFGLAAGVCAPAQAQTAGTSDLINGLGGPGSTDGVLQLGSFGLDVLNGQNAPYTPYYGFRHGQGVSGGQHLPWVPPYAMGRLTCISGDDPVYGATLNGANTMAGIAAAPGGVTNGPGGPVIPTPQLVGTAQPSVEQAGVLAGVAQQAAPPVDASAPQMAAPAMQQGTPQAALPSPRSRRPPFWPLGPRRLTRLRSSRPRPRPRRSPTPRR
ncbi:hypothetical protein ACFQX6_46335 [Streptosporangium lutulentum]